MVYLSTALNFFPLFILTFQLSSLGLEIAWGGEALKNYQKELAFSVALVCAALMGLVHVLARSGSLEKFLSLFYPWRKPIHSERAKLDPIVRDFAIRAGVQDPVLYIDQSEHINACAMGRRTICVTTEALKKLTQDELQALLGHEFAHLHYKDSEKLGIIYGVRALPELISKYSIGLAWKLVSRFDYSRVGVVSIVFLPVTLVVGIISLSIFVVTFPFLLIDRKLMPFFERKYSRDCEYRADQFAATHTSSAAVLSLLKKLEESNKQSLGTFFERLFHTHPPLAYRIDRMETMTTLGTAEPVGRAA